MKKINLFVILLSLFTAASLAHAEAPAPTPEPTVEEMYPNYNATVLPDYTAVQRLFNGLPTSFKMKRFMSGGSQCFQRAEIWTYDMYRNKHINAMKVFVFYTHAYKEAYQRQFGHSFVWWFHVSPYVLAKDANGQVKELTTDPSFADKPLNIQDWSMLFVDTKKKCKEYVPYSQFRNEVEGGPDATVGTEHCYLVRVPAADYDPRAVEARDSGEVKDYQFDLRDVKAAAKLAPTNDSRDYIMSLMGL